MDKLQKAQQLEREAKELRYQAAEEKRAAERKEKEAFEKQNNMDVYTSDDYCGLEAGRYQFYYGYEEVWCVDHGPACPEGYDCEKSEWAFTAQIDGKEVMRLPKSKLHPEKGEVPFWYLVAGIGHFLKLDVENRGD